MSLPPPNDRVAEDVALIERISAVPTILRIVCETTGLGFAAVARVTEARWVACAVLDRIGFGLLPGGELEVTTTLCHETRTSRTPIVIDAVSQDAAYRNHPTPRLYGFESYISVPIIRRNGEVFGTICAIDPQPAALRGTPVLPTLTLFAELVAAQIEIEERLAASDTALLDAAAVGALREQFIAVLGHDLRNPLAAVAAGAELLDRQALPPRARGIVGQMRQASHRMAGLVDDILDFARGRLGGGIPVDRQPAAALGTILAGVVDELRSSHPGRAIEADIALDAPLRCDPRRIAQLLSNLLGNALVHGATDQPVRVVARGDAAGFTLTVANGGVPIPPEVQARLFQPFSRDAADAPRAGLGLGLYIAAEIARSHGGVLGLTSDAAGTVFTLEIPAAA